VSRPTRERIALLDFPFEFESELARAAWRRCLGPPPWARPREEPILTLKWRDLEPTRHRRPPDRAAAEWLEGAGFALDFARREMHLDYPACGRPMVPFPANARRGLGRYAVFGASLLAEDRGPRAVARAALGWQVPLCLHASAVLGPQGALVFCGHSTFGKSTIAKRLLGRYPLLGEDAVTLLVGPTRRPAAPRVICFQRWPGRAAAGTTRPWFVPLRGVFWLRKAPEFGLEQLSTGEAAAHLLHPIFTHDFARATRHRLSLLHALLAAAPCRRLSFRKERTPLVAFLKRAGFL
jgi:hypothetical protein